MARPRNPEKPQAEAKPGTPEDVVFVHGRSDDGTKLAVIRKRGETLSAGVIAAVEQGQPVHGDLVRLHARENTPALFDVEVVYEPPATSRTDDAAGPAQVATAAYREGWDSIWGTRRGKPRSSAELN